MSLVLSNVHDPNVQVSLAGWSLGARAATRFAGVLERMGSCVRGIFALDDRRKLPFSPAEAQQSIGLVGLLCAAETVPAFRASALCRSVSPAGCAGGLQGEKEKTAKHTRHLLLSARFTFVFFHGLLIISMSCQTATSWWLVFLPAWLGDALSLLLVVISWFGSCPYIHLCLQERQARLGDGNPSILTEILPDIFFGILSFIYLILALIGEILLCRYLARLQKAPTAAPTSCAVFLIINLLRLSSAMGLPVTADAGETEKKEDVEMRRPLVRKKVTGRQVLALLRSPVKGRTKGALPGASNAGAAPEARVEDKAVPPGSNAGAAPQTNKVEDKTAPRGSFLLTAEEASVLRACFLKHKRRSIDARLLLARSFTGASVWASNGSPGGDPFEWPDLYLVLIKQIFDDPEKHVD
eukprot:g24541.t1